ncbi:Dps family protein [Roseococcus microcysteis]|uniref:Dps family protein n=1 Tax=Roseococcus microcysteis TaxID=2771361 RepID=UPI00168BF0E8|nr:DNA starvation/stationary phase protection protein [Roseococcus microcysteis]
MSTTKKSPAANDAAGGIAAALTGYVADTYVLMAKTQACHWNATGPGFIGMHQLTEAQYKELFLAVDELAERLRALGEPAPRSLNAMLDLATLDELEDKVDVAGAYRTLADDNTKIAVRARELAEAAEEAEDIATHDMLVHRIEVHEKAAWLLRSHVA